MFKTRTGVRLWASMVILLLAVLIISVFTTSPDELGPYGLTLWFVALFVASSGALSAALFWYKRLSKKGIERSRLLGEAIRQSVLIGIWVTSIVALNSLRQLSLRDVLLLTLLLVLVEFYMRRGR